MAKKKSTNRSETLVAAATVTAESITTDDHDTVNATTTTKGGSSSVMTDDANNTNNTTTTTSITEVYELLQVDLGDMIKVKQVLDECVAMILLDYLPENTTWDNCKLGIMTCACIAAMIAQFNQYSNITIHFNRYVLILCGSIYFLCSTILQFITTFIDQDTIIYTQPITEKTEQQRIKNRKNHLSLMMQIMNSSSGSSTATKSNGDDDDDNDDNDDLTTNSLYLYYNRTTKSFTSPEPALPLQNKKLNQYGLRIRTSLPRFSQYYTITFEFDIPKKEMSLSSFKNCMVTKTYSIGQFFDHQGYFDEIGFANTIEELFITQFDMEQYTTTSTTNDNSSRKKQD